MLWLNQKNAKNYVNVPLSYLQGNVWVHQMRKKKQNNHNKTIQDCVHNYMFRKITENNTAALHYIS